MGSFLAVVLVLGAAAGLAVFAYRWDKRRAQDDHDQAGPLDQLMEPEPVTVEHEGAVEGWSPAGAYSGGDPLTAPLSDIQLGDAWLYDEIAAAHPVRLDWAPPTASQAWALAGARLDEMGETQPIAKVPA